MRGFLSLLFGSLIVIIMIFTPGNTAQAATEPVQVAADEEHCGCDITFISGAERNKIVSDLLKTDEFKALKMDLKKEGYTWKGAHAIEVIRNNTFGGLIMVGVPFENGDGTKEFFGFVLIDRDFIGF